MCVKQVPVMTGVPTQSTPQRRALRSRLRAALPALVAISLAAFSITFSLHVATPANAAPATVLVDESFTGATVPDPLIQGIGSTCLTGATASNARLNACPPVQVGPVPARGVTPGYLQLTDAASSKSGALFYNRPIPSSAGIDATFETFQYGGTGADGMMFYLADGAAPLTAVGGGGGSLGYAQRFNEPGVVGGYLGIGLDVFGNYYGDGEGRGKGCAPGQRSPTMSSGSIAPNTVTLRGPGNGLSGYCYMASTVVAGSPPGKPTSSLPGRLSATTLGAAKRTIHVVISPAPTPLITVQIDFDDGMGFRTVINNLAAPAGTPATYKFGFAGSTGGVTDVHLLRNVVVGTVTPLASLNLVKQVSRQSALPPILVAGSSIPYEFVVTNSGSETLHGLAITDPGVGTATCSASVMPPAPDPASTVVCTGSHTVTATEVSAGQVVNAATATALDPVDAPVTSNSDSVTVPIRATLSVTKSPNTAGPYRLGQSVNYFYTVTNTGGAALTNVAITDAKAVGTISCPTTSLAPGQVVTCNGWYVVALADIAANGTVSTPASAAGTSDIGQAVTAAAVVTAIPVAADLSVTKVVNNTSPTVGNAVTYTITVANSGPSPARLITIGAPIPTGATNISAVASAGTYSAATGVWSIPLLASGASATLTEIDRVDTSAVIVNGATILSAEQPDLNPANNSASVTLNPVVPTTDLALVKSYDASVIRVGDTVTATVTVNNVGPRSATGVSVRDPLPHGLEFVSAVGQGTYNPTTGVWSVGSIGYPGSATIRIKARATSTGFVLNTASLASVTPVDSNQLNDVANAPLEIDFALADLAVTKIVRPADSALIGDEVAFAVTAHNNGPSAATGVIVNDPVPAGLSFVSSSAEQGSYSVATGRWSVGTLDPGQTVLLEVFFTANAAGRVSNSAVISGELIEDPDAANNVASAGLQINPPPDPPVDVGVTMTSSVTGDVRRGDPVTLDVTLSNDGPGPATGVQFTNTFTGSFDFVSATPSQGTVDPLTGIWEVGTINVGAQPTLSISVIITAVSGDHSNVMSLTGVDQIDTNTQNDSASLSGHVVAEADLSVVKTVSPTVAEPGDTVTYTIVVTNNGPDPDAGVQLVETLRLSTPAAITGITLSQGSFDAPSLVWDVGALDVGASATIEVEILVDRAGHIENRTVVFAADLPDPDLSNNGDSATLALPGANLALTKTVADASIRIGTQTSFSIRVTNSGPDTAVDVEVTDQIPSGLTFVSADPDQGAFDEATGIWSVGNLLPGATVILELVVVGAEAGTYVNSATASSAVTPDIDVSNNEASVTLTVSRLFPPPPPDPDGSTVDLSLSKTASPTRVVVGGTITYAFTVINNGTATATGILITDELPIGINVASLDSRCTVREGVFRCQMGSLAPDASTSTRMSATVVGAGSVTNNAAVSADQFDGSLGDNDASAGVTAGSGLARTGGDLFVVAAWAICLFALGCGMVVSARRRRA